MKKHLRILLLIGFVFLIIAAFFLIPFDIKHYEDGGTVEICARLYRVVKWNRLEFIMETPADGEEHHLSRNQSTNIYFFPDYDKTIDDLWKEKMSH